jgi:hypothetical protein
MASNKEPLIDPLLFQITKREERERKYWLLATICSRIVYPVVVFLLFDLMAGKIQFTQHSLYKLSIDALIGLVLLWMIVHCAYKKHGTKLLLIWLVIIPFRMLFSIIFLVKESHNPWIVAQILLECTMYAWWYILSLRLRKINKTIQYFHVLKNSEEYKKAMSEIQAARTLEDLDSKFHTARKNWPDLEYSLIKEYRSKRTNLEFRLQISTD